MTEREKLEKAINEARIAYYNLEPTISDDEYDSLLESYKNKFGKNDVYNAVGAKPTSEWEKVSHEILMGSLDKVNSKDEFVSWCRKFGQNTEFLITEKLDGSSLEIVYENGNLVRCVTRGDGDIGQDITLNAIKVNGVVKSISLKEKVIVRGEVIMKKSVFMEKYSSQYSNTRNTANGKLIERGDNSHCSNLEFIAYFMVKFDSDQYKKESQMFNELSSLGFSVPVFVVGDVALAVDHFSKTNSIRDMLGHDIDGMVVSVNDSTIKESFGVKDNRPVAQIAWKFESKSVGATITGVKWQVGPTGRITPVATVEPIKIDGVTVTNVSMHNIGMFNALNVGFGDIVRLVRANDVIPYITNKITDISDTKFSVVESCPECSSSVIIDGMYAMCVNEKCRSKISGSIKVWIEKNGIMHWGDAMIDSLSRSDLINDVSDLYRLTVDDIAEHTSGIKMATKCYNSLNSKKEFTMQEVLSSLNITDLGPSTADEIVRSGFKSISDLKGLTCASLISMDGVGIVKSKSLYNGIMSKIDVIEKLNDVLTISSPSGSLKGLTFCITGSTKVPRRQLEGMIVLNGGSVKSSVCKQVTHLVCNSDSSDSTKSSKAASMGVKVIHEKTLMSMMK